MHHGSPHPGIAGSDLPRLLARLADLPPPEGRPVFAERLGQWLGWTGDIALSAALAQEPRAPRHAGTQVARSSQAGTPDGEALDPAEDLDQTAAWLATTLAPRPRELEEDPCDFETHRRHCLARQHAMQDTIGSLRTRLRAALPRQAPSLARLAAIDEVMEQSLAPHERRLMALVPLRLQSHFERLQREAAGHGDASRNTPAREAARAASRAEHPGAGPNVERAGAPPMGPAWVAAFRDDMRCVLQAELAHRLLPCRGLVDALRPTR